MNLVKISDIFDVQYGVNLDFNKMDISIASNGIPFISRTSKNNGVQGYVSMIEGIIPNTKHTLSVAGGGSVLETFYQPKPYYSGRDLYILTPRQDLTIKEMLAYATIIRRNKYRYSFGRQANRTLRDILIPSVNDVQDLIKNISIPKKPTNKASRQKKLSLQDKHWQYFKISNLFKIEKCKCSNSQELLECLHGIFYIGAKKNDNGIMKKVELNKKLVSNGNGIVFIGNGQGSAGYSTYQPSDFIGSSSLSIGYNNNINKYNAIFLVTILDQERFKYCFGRSWNNIRIKNTKIKLPVDEQGNPDWQFMEYYIKSLPYSSNL